MSEKILVIPDTHFSIHTDWGAAKQIGEAIADVKPDIVIQLGDFGDFDSLSDYEAMDERSYRQDVAAVIKGFKLLWGPMRKLKKKLPHRVILEGNHEYRETKYTRKKPELVGFIDIERHCKIAKYWDEYVRYDGESPGIYKVNDVLFSHSFAGGVMNRPIGGIHAAHTILNKLHKSAVCGHSHLLDVKTQTDGDGKEITAIVAGCAFTEDHAWAGGANRYYNKGYLILNDVSKGEIGGFQWIKLK